MKENQDVEWKETWRDEYLRWICGFANAEGGTLIIGRNDRGEPVGVQNAERLLTEIPNKVRDLLGIMVDVNLREQAGAEYLEIVVPAYPNPISYRGEYYYRSGSTNQTLKGAALDRFLLRRQGRHWDDAPVPGIGVADLSPKAITRFRGRAARSGRMAPELLAEPDAVLLDKLRLFDHGYVKRAAILLFHDDPERIATGAYVKVGFFRTDSDLLYHDEIHGDLFTQVDRTLDLVFTKYLRAGIAYEGVQRVETYPIAEAALREAVINAIAHKDYAASIPIQISVYYDKLMIWNPGVLPPGWTADFLTAKHASAPYNPDVANAFFRAALLESWGRGIDLIRDACHAHGAPAPVFRWDNGLWVELPFLAAQVRPESRPESGLESRPESGAESGPMSGPMSRPMSGMESRLESDLAARIVIQLTTGPLGSGALATALGHRIGSGALHRQIRRLLNQGYIAMTIPDKPRSRLQKYRLTPAGEALLAELRPGEAGQ